MTMVHEPHHNDKATERVITALESHGCNPRRSGAGWQARCPVHGAGDRDRTPSLSVGQGDDGRALVHCHAGCTVDAICAAIRMTVADLMPPSARNGKPRIVASYDYQDERGSLLFQVVRFAPKDFRQRKPDGNGGWTWKVKGTRIVPFRLPQLLAADATEIVFICEGEKDCLNLERVGCVATCNAGGAGKWRADHAQFLRGRRVVVLPDNDEPGRKHADQVARSLRGISDSIRVVELPGLPEKGDVSDWINAGGTRDQLLQLVEAASEWTAEQSPTPRPRRQVAIDIDSDNDRTDNGLATRFIDTHGHDLRFVVKWKKWIVWDGKRWAIDMAGVRVLRMARQFADSLWNEFTELAKHPDVSRDEIAALRSWIRSTNRKYTIESIVSLATADKRVEVSLTELNQHHKLLNCPNGTVDLTTGKLGPHCREHLITQIATVEYRPDASCDQWLTTLNLICNDDSELVEYLQRLLGYSIAANAGEALLPIVFGSGANGKSTVWNCIVDLLGDYATLANDTLLLGDKDGHPTEKADLYEKRFVAISEPERSATLKEARVKELTGDKLIKARRMFENLWEFRRSHTFWLSTNHLPRITGTDDAIWRRVKLIPFEVDLRIKVKPIPNFSDWLVANEGPGILAWLVRGFMAWQAGGLAEPRCVRQATDAYRQNSDHIGEFVREWCIVETEAVVTANDLFECYEKQHGGKWSKTAFGRAMAERFPKEKPQAGEYRKQTIYRGIRLLGDFEPNPQKDGDFDDCHQLPPVSQSPYRICADSIEGIARLGATRGNGQHADPVCSCGGAIFLGVCDRCDHIHDRAALEGQGATP